MKIGYLILIFIRFILVFSRSFTYSWPLSSEEPLTSSMKAIFFFIISTLTTASARAQNTQTFDATSRIACTHQNYE